MQLPWLPWLMCASLSLWCVSAGVAHAGDAAKGKASYDARCAFCHGKEGKGDGPAGKALKPPPTNFSIADFWRTATPEGMAEVIEHGKRGTAMMAFGASLNHEQTGDLITYLMTFKSPD